MYGGPATVLRPCLSRYYTAMPAAQITGCYLAIARRVRHKQHELNSARREFSADTPEHEGGEWLGKTRELSSNTTNAIDPVGYIGQPGP
jgi:hypothetical protein